ncbi:MAG: aminopeptidase P family protein [Deltaproteobacteria bacterium]|nr:aminopeptidase P family protein [Deltaproteobacteria bacterium]
MKNTVHLRRIETLKKKLHDMAVDGAWIIRPENRRYLSGFKAEDFQLNESSGSLLISRKACLLITDSRYTAEAAKEARDFEIYTLKKDLAEEFPSLVDGLGIKVLGFEEDFLVWGLHQKLNKGLKKLPGKVRLTPLKGLVEGMREVKDQSEIKALAASARLMDSILAKVIDELEPGLTEKQVAWRIEELAREAGADGMAFPSIVASGPNSALPHAVPTKRRLRRKEPIVFDVGINLKGYRSDMTRTVFLDTPGPSFRKIYRTVREAQLAALEVIKPGINTAEVDAAARNLIRESGFGEYFGHALGHGVGLATHEGPRLSPRNPVVLKENMVVTVEPGIYIPGKGGVRLEEMVVLRKNGPRILTGDPHFYDF